MNHIVVPTDFSGTADRAVEFAIQSAKYIPGQITLLHCFEVGDSLVTDYVGVDKEFSNAMLAEARGRLEEMRKEIYDTHGIAVNIEVSGLPLAQALNEVVDKKDAGLIVMGTLGSGGLGNKIFGSKTAEVIGKSSVPVLAIPTDYEWKKPSRILFSTNKFEKQAEILDFIFEMADLYMAKVRTAVFTDADDDKAQKYVENEEKMKEYEKFLRAEYKEDTLSAQHLFGERFEETLQEYIDEKEVDILVMVTYQDSVWRRFFNPSKTKRMSYDTNIPLLAIPVAKA